jgi:putative endonuclease
MWNFYILKSERHGKFYVGISQNPTKRFQQHNSEENTGYTSKGRPWIMMGVWKAADSEAEALLIERFIKNQKNTRIIHHLLDNKPLHGPLAGLVRIPF